MTHTNKQHAITQENSSHATSSHIEHRYIIHVHTQTKREYDYQDECNKDSLYKDDQDNVQARKSTLRQTRDTTK